MSVRSGFFNSVNHDRKYTSEDIGEMFNGLFSDGIFKDAVIRDGYETNDKFAVTADGGFHLLVGTGKAWFNKIWILNDTKTGVMIGEPHLILPRIDAVVIQIDKKDKRDVQITVVQGLPAANPVKPTLRSDSDNKVYQYALAYVRVNANASAITQSNITNAVGTTETPYASYLGQAAVNIKVAYNLTTTEPGWVLAANQGKKLNDRIPFSFGIDSNGRYGYKKNGTNTVIPFMSDKVVDLGVGTRFDITSYQGYQNFTVNKNFFLTVNSIYLSDGLFSNDIDYAAWLDYPEYGPTYREHALSGSGPTPSLSYNQDTGILTVNNTRGNQISDMIYVVTDDAEEIAHANVRFVINVTCRVFLVY